MTLRNYLARRTSWVIITGGVIFLALHAVASFEPNPSAWRDAAMIELPAAFVVAWIAKSLARCPVCSGSLGYIDFGNKRNRRPPKVGCDRCRRCGLHLDAIIPPKD